MIYNLSNDFFNDFNCYEDNALPPRSYFVPFKDRASLDKTTYLDERYESSLLKVLNGKWDFAFYEKISDMPLELDTESVKFDSVKVPGCWQFQGYEKPFYINTRYMFDLNTRPYVPADTGIYGKNFRTDNGQKTVEVHNSVGVYRKTFTLKKSARNIITFLGVSSCVQLYVNGYYVGYGEGSHNTHEFDITEYLAEDGKNEIVVLVYKWCNGTYLECQDMFRNNGIFRDVYVTSYNEDYVWDYRVSVKRNDKENYSVCVDAESVLSDGAKLCVTLYDGKKQVGIKEGDKTEFTLSQPKLWSAEIPNLYTAYIEIVKDGKIVQSIRQEVGIKEIAIKNCVFLFNDKPIKIKGVNHHDTHESNGYTVTAEELLDEAKLMKQLNVNAVRTSHYPPDPVFIKIANHLGLYIIDEADIETHGCYATYFPLPRPNLISNNKKWRNHFWDRVYRMYMRDKNNACVTMWSLGNESGGWKNQDYCYARLKELDKGTPIHYEGVCRGPRFNYDVVSQMYASTEFYEKYVEGKAPKKFYRAPYFQCEYAHSMGVGPGSLDLYMKLFDKTPTALGGCIWEWADHAVKTKKGYLYGGDNGEYAHDSNFCVDGLVYPDRTPSPSAYNMQAVYRPVRADYISNNKYLLRNTNRFLSTSYLDIKWQYVRSGEIITEGKIENEILPMDSCEVTIKHPALDTTKDCYINFVYTDKKSKKVIAKEQISLCKFIKKGEKPEGKDIVCLEENGFLKVITNKAKVIFDMQKGKISSYVVGEREFLSADKSAQVFVPNVYRAPIDNYMYVVKGWKKLGLDDIKTELVSFEYKKNSNCALISTEEKLVGNSKHLFNVYTEYRVYDNGEIDVKPCLEKIKAVDIPKFGLNLELPAQFNRIEYYGRGDKENYSDMSAHAIMGIYKTDTDGMFEHYIKPQDNGNRCDVRWAKITDKEGDGLEFVAISEAFNFNANRYTDKAIAQAKHDFELSESDKSVVRIDGFVRGVGSNSCGPDTRAEYRHNSTADIVYEFRMKPVFKPQKSEEQAVGAQK